MITVIPIRFAEGNQWVHIRELTGADEQAVTGSRSIDAILLLNRIIQSGPGVKRVVKSECLTITDRDDVLFALYLNTYGPLIETSYLCPACNQQFDINFSLEELRRDMSTNNLLKRNGTLPTFHSALETN